MEPETQKFLIGSGILLAGLSIAISDGFSFRGSTITPSAGIVLFGIGVLFFLWPKFFKKEKFYKYKICKDCESKFESQYVHFPNCPKCNGELFDSKK